jgi:ABC-type glycerol-3-phosphate transport system permease component
MKATNIGAAVRTVGIYVLLVGGSAVFLWPFLWMAATSVKMDREMFTEKLHLLPQTPWPPKQSPYIDTQFFQDVNGPHMKAALHLIEARLDAPGLAAIWPPDVGKMVAVRETARGVYRRLLDRWPVARWELAAPAMQAEIDRTVDAGLASAALGRVRRSLRLLQFRARSYDLQEQVLVPANGAAEAWHISGDARARLVPGHDADGDYTTLAYDFSHGDTIGLTGTFTTDFPVSRLYRLQLALRPDGSWHGMTLFVEKLGVRYRAAKTNDLGDFKPGVVTWQEPGPDDLTNKIRTWTLLREESRSPAYESDPHELKVTIQIRRVSLVGAWWAKIRRNYRLVLDNVPFGRYVATSLFLVILNIAGALASGSLAAYSFSRLHWPGRNFCFTLLLATMMIPGQLTMIPHFLIMRWLGWYNTLYPLWVGSFFASAFNVFLLRQFMKGIPRDLEDAARIDGCGFLRTYWHVALPLVRPTLTAIAIFTFMGTWNDFMGPLVYLSDQRLYPLSFGLYALNVQSNAATGMMMAGSLLMTLPIIVIFFFAQRFFLQSVAFSGVK